MTTPTIVDRAVQDFQEWLHQIQQAAQFADEQQAYQALRGVLHLLRDCVTPDEATDFGAQLPTLVRGIYYEGYAPRQTPEKARSEGQFLEALRERIEPAKDVDVDKAALAVFACLESKLDPGAVDHIVQMLPGDVQALWPEPVQERGAERSAAG